MKYNKTKPLIFSDEQKADYAKAIRDAKRLSDSAIEVMYEALREVVK